MYHSISDDDEPGRPAYYKVCTSPQRFREQMRWLADAGAQCVTVKEGIDLLAGDAVPNRRPVVLTFDDGFRDNLTAALPVLEEFGFTATVYLPTACIGHQRRTFKDRECLTWSEVREMAARGIHFGSHTVNHSVLYDLPFDQVNAELTDSKRELEDRLQTPVSSFAYPYAFPQEDRDYVTRFSESVRQAGYDECMTTLIGSFHPGEDRLALKRLPVNSCDDEALFTAKLNGAYDGVAAAQSWVRRARHWRRAAADLLWL